MGLVYNLRTLINNQQKYMKAKTKKFFLLFSVSIILSCPTRLFAQKYQNFEHIGEGGFALGASHYFGDLTPSNNLLGSLHPSVALSAFYQKQTGDYLGYRLSAFYLRVGYSDAFNSDAYYKERNLSFTSDIFELSLQGSFNFFRFVPELAEYSFTPYMSLGAGIFFFSPYTEFNGGTYYLRELRTEGEANPYSNLAVCVPLTFGVKYAVTSSYNVFAEFSYRFTTTGYLDDVHGNYAGTDAFRPGTIAYSLQDRSNEVRGDHENNPHNIKGRQRGNGMQKDSYATLQVGITFNLQGYRCPGEPN